MLSKWKRLNAYWKTLEEAAKKMLSLLSNDRPQQDSNHSYLETQTIWF